MRSLFEGEGTEDCHYLCIVFCPTTQTLGNLVASAYITLIMKDVNLIEIGWTD